MPNPFSKDLETLVDGDSGFRGVVSRLSPDLVEPGFVSDAVNRRFDSGVIANRWGIVRPVWGGVWSTATRTTGILPNSTTQNGAGGTVVPTDRQVAVDPGAYCVVGVTGLSGGTGYTSAPTVTFTGGTTVGTRVNATGVATVAAGAVTAITISTVGMGYGSSTGFAVGFSGGGGSGASATTVMARGQQFQGGVTRVVSDDNTNVITSTTSFNFTGTRNLIFYNNTTTLGDIVGSCVYVDQRTGVEMLLVAVNEARSNGGQGNVYVIKPGQSHRTAMGYSSGTAPLPMNGYDFSSTVRMVPCLNGVVMMRPGPERFYFTGSGSVSATSLTSITSTTITTAVAHGIVTGQKIRFGVVTGSSSSGMPNDGVVYYANAPSTTTLKLYTTKALALVGGTPVALTVTTSANRYYIEVAEVLNFYSPSVATADNASSIADQDVNDSRSLIMQATSSNPNPLDAGFLSVDTIRQVTGAETDTVTASYWVLVSANHALVPGDQIALTVSSGLTGASTATYYVFPVDSNRFRLYATEALALAGIAGSAGSQTNVTATGTGTFLKSGASGAVVPNAREAIYFQSRLLLLYGRDNLAVSDVLDLLHYSPLVNEFKLNTGTNDRVTTIYPFNATTLIVFKDRSILAIENIYGDLSNVRLTELTREFGCIAPLSIASTGSDLVFLSTRGVATIQQTAFGVSQNVVVPLSDPIQDKIERIDQVNAHKSCGAYFNNRYIVSVPEEDGDGTNTMTLVFNFLNKSWEGEWNGTYLVPTQFNRLNCYGTDRLTWTDDSGFVHYFDPDALKDSLNVSTEIDIETSVNTRGYSCQTKQSKQWSRGVMEMETWDPDYSVVQKLDGVNEVTTLRDGITKSRTDYYKYGVTAWDPTNVNDDFLTAYRQDYSLQPGFRCGTNGITVDTHQVFEDKMNLVRNGPSTQLLLTTNQGSVRLKSTELSAVSFSKFGKTDL